jgi:large subunit ribosomal protein L10e
MITGAGADRVQDGMRLAFGKVIGRAARIKPRQPLISIRCNEKYIKQARRALKKAAPKLPTPCRLIFDKIDSKLKRSLGFGN